MKINIFILLGKCLVQSGVYLRRIRTGTRDVLTQDTQIYPQIRTRTGAVTKMND